MRATRELDVVGEFVDDMRAYGKSKSTVYEYERVLRDYEEEIDVSVADADRRDCMAYVETLRGRGLSPSSIATYASYLHRFYSYADRVDEYPVDSNPMALVNEHLTESIDKNPRRRELDVEDVRGFLATVHHPRDRCMLLTLFKTGVRAGELTNLRLEDVSLDGLDDELGIGGAVSRRDTLLVRSDVPGNKRVRDTRIPVDDELRRELARWLRVRPERGPHVFVSLSPSGDGGLTSESVSAAMRRYTEPHGWWDAEADMTENVTPHYCRHFFTTYMRDASGDDALVKYLRGDVGGDAIDTYTHQWGDRVREKYERHIYSLT
ncbi:MAG: tyrosine-type recombinase/integrase [Halobacteriota archaeon]